MVREGKSARFAFIAQLEAENRLDNAILPSVGRTGSCFDNAAAESFNALFKKELHSIHTDHRHASVIAEHARFYAGLPMEHPLSRHGVSRVLYAQNWEDAEGFRPTEHVEIPQQAFDVWREAIQEQAFARGETYGFRYIDYYSALMISNGCLARVDRPSGFAAKEEAGLNDTLM